MLRRLKHLNDWTKSACRWSRKRYTWRTRDSHPALLAVQGTSSLQCGEQEENLPLTSSALFAYLIIRLFQLVFLVGTIFFSHNKSTGTIFRLVFSAKLTGPKSFHFSALQFGTPLHAWPNRWHVRDWKNKGKHVHCLFCAVLTVKPFSSYSMALFTLELWNLELYSAHGCTIHACMWKRN